MNESFRSGFLRLTECHARAVADINQLRKTAVNTASDDSIAALARAFAKEEEARAALIEWRPNSNIEAQFKFLYMVEYLVRAKASLNRQEMAGMLESIAHILKKQH
jgi:hypothetical protein